MENSAAITYTRTAFANSLATRFLSLVFAPYYDLSYAISITDDGYKLRKTKKRKGKCSVLAEIDLRKENIVRVKRCYWYIGFIFNLILARYKVRLKNNKTIVLQFHKGLAKKSMVSKILTKKQPFKELNLFFDSEVQKKLFADFKTMKR